MRIVFALLLAVHALIHLMGVAKAFDLAPLSQLKIPISHTIGAMWLAAAACLLAADVSLFVAPRWFWLIGILGLATSQFVIALSWSDARFGTIANIILLGAVVYAGFAWGPFGLRAEYEHLVRGGMTRLADMPGASVVGDADVASLPPLVRRYLHAVGVVGAPTVAGFRARMSGRIRGSATAPWMPFVAEQHNFFDPPRRYFWMEATRSGLPIDGLHAYEPGGASMRIRLLSLIPVVGLSGPDMMRTETVTVFNDMCVMAPARLLDPSIRWRELDDHSVEATYTNGPHTIRSVLLFSGDSGLLTNFWSDDRPSLAEDGRTMLDQRWSTPLVEYRKMPPYLLATRGEARYAAPTGDYAYIEFTIDTVTAIGR